MDKSTTSDSKLSFATFVNSVYLGRFYSRTMTYFEEAGLFYWTMGAPIDETTIINRCRKEDSFEAREIAGRLPQS